MINKKKRLFKILFFPISMMLCFSLFLINSFAQAGYELNSNGDIQSFNLFDTDFTFNQGGGLGTFARDNNHFTFNVTQASDFYIFMPNGFNLIGGTYTISLSSYSNIEMFVLIINDNWITTSNSSHTFTITDTDIVKIRIDANQNYVGIFEFDLMLNSGNVALDYFPYGFYSSTDVNPFSPNNISLIDFLGYGNAYDWTQLPKENAYKYFSIQSLQIQRFLNDNNINEYNTNFGRVGIEIDLINPIDISNYHYLFNFFNDSYNGTPTNDFYIGFSRYHSTDNYIIYYTQQEDTQYQSSFTVDLPANFLCDSISVFWYNVDTNRNILQNITLGGYDLGYNNGVKDGRYLGYQSGYNSGLSAGQASGYQNGYNDGINTDLETNGLKTLFNSILSFPVDMIKSVFNFEFMGVNIASVITFIISIGIVAFVLKKFL